MICNWKGDGRCVQISRMFNDTPRFSQAMTPNLLARTIETVEGGGIIVLLLRTVRSLKQLYTMAMVRKRVENEGYS